MSSQTDFEMIFEFVGTSKKVIGHIERIRSPHLIQTLLDKAPFTVRSRGNIGMPKTYWMVLVEIKKGGERDEYKDAKKGDIVYCPRQDALYLVYEDNPKFSLPVHFIGVMQSGVDDLKDLRNGTMVKISFKDVSN